MPHFGDMTMSLSVSGMGTNGVCSECFSFSVPLWEHQNYMTEFAGGTVVHLGGDYSSPNFYISSKDVSENSIKVTCYDRMAFAAAAFPCTESDFTDQSGDEIPMPIGTVLSRICSTCGFSNSQVDSDLLFAAANIPKSLLLGKSCHDVLGSLSTAFCGYWCVSGTVLTFVPLSGDTIEHISGVSSVQYHEELRQNTRLTISHIYLTDNTQKFGTDTGCSDTLCISTSLANTALYNALLRARHLYRSISCGNAYLEALPMLPFGVAFAGGGSEYINYCNAKISSKGILASLGRNNVDEGTFAYQSRTQREFEKRYAEGDVWKNAEITKDDGLKMVYVNENSGGKTKFGFDVHDEGLTIYDGGMMSKQGVSDIDCTYDPSDDSKLTGLAFTYCGETVQASITWDGDDISSVTMTGENN